MPRMGRRRDHFCILPTSTQQLCAFCVETSGLWGQDRALALPFERHPWHPYDMYCIHIHLHYTCTTSCSAGDFDVGRTLNVFIIWVFYERESVGCRGVARVRVPVSPLGSTHGLNEYKKINQREYSKIWCSLEWWKRTYLTCVLQ